MNRLSIKQLFSRYKLMALLIAIALIWAFFSVSATGLPVFICRSSRFGTKKKSLFS